MSQLRLLYQDTVTGDEIDRNGHLNVRFYAARAMRATQALAESLGLDACPFSIFVLVESAHVFAHGARTRSQRVDPTAHQIQAPLVR